MSNQVLLTSLRTPGALMRPVPCLSAAQAPYILLTDHETLNWETEIEASLYIMYILYVYVFIYIV